MWITFLFRRPGHVPDANSRLCSCHFEKQLKSNGPTIFFKSIKDESADVKIPGRYKYRFVCLHGIETRNSAFII